MKGWTRCLLIMLVLILPGLSPAEDQKDYNLSETTMEEVIVTATRQDEKISSVPANVTVVTEKDIKNSTAYNIPELLKQKAGVHVSDISGNQRNYTVDLRGFGETAPLNTLVLVDGRRINQADLSGTDWTLIPLERVKKIEIIRSGRGSVLYGDNAAGGIINIITKEGEKFKTGGEVVAGSYDTFKGSAYVSGAKKDLSYALSGSYLTSDGYRENSATNATDLGLNLNTYKGDHLKWDLSGAFHKDSAGLPGAIKASDFAAGVSRTDSLFPNDFADIEDYYVKGGQEIFFLRNSQFNIDLSFRRRDASSFFSFTDGSFTGDTDIKTVAVSSQFICREKLWGVDNNLIIGFDYADVNEDITNSSIFFGFPSIGIYELGKQNYGIYIHDEINPWNNLAISGGYRYDRANFTFDPSTPDNETMDENLFTVGVNYSFLERSSAYISYARSFRYPVLDEFYNFFTNTVDTTLQPQTSDDFEFGIRYYFKRDLFTKINFFRIDTDDELIFNTQTFSNENLDGPTRRDGFEISLTKTFKKVTLSANYTFTDATITSGQYAGSKFPNVPRNQVGLKSLFSLGRGFSLALDGFYVGERPFISDFSNSFEDQEDYLVFNTKFIYQWKKMNLYLNINNITNQEYSAYGVISSPPNAQPAFYPSPEINFAFGVSGDF